MQPVTLIDEDLLIRHGALGSIYPGAWSQILAKHFGGSEHSWYIALTTVYPYWDSPSVSDRSRTLTSSDLSVWHDTRRRIVEHWIERAKHEEPSLQEITISRNALKSLEREAGRLCKQSSDRFRIRVMQYWSRRGSQFAIVSRDTSAELIRGMLDRHQATIPVIGPEELGQVGFDGLAWDALAAIAGADPDASRFITRLKIDAWPIVSPDRKAVWKSLDKLYWWLTKVTKQDYGPNFNAIEKWLAGQDRWHWLRLLRYGTRAP